MSTLPSGLCLTQKIHLQLTIFFPVEASTRLHVPSFCKAVNSSNIACFQDGFCKTSTIVVGTWVELLAVEFDFMHLARYSKKVISNLKKGYEEYKQIDPKVIPMRVGKLVVGSSDANIYVKKGHEAAFIIVLDKDTKHKPSQWHTINDTMEFIDKKILQDIIGISIYFVKEIETNY